MQKTKSEVIILGATGQLGSEWLAVLESKGIKVKGFSSKDLDITDEIKLKEIISTEHPTLVINCSAYTKVDLAETEWDKAVLVNAFAVGKLAKICSEFNIKLIHYSTDYVFSGVETDLERFPNGYSEDQIPAPQNNYGISKFLGEMYIREAMSDYLIIRVAWLCGKNGSNFIKSMLKYGSERPELTVVNDQFGAPSFVDNVIENTICLINAHAKGTFHIASNGITNWYEFAKTAIQLKELKTKITPVSSKDWPSKVKRPSFSKLNTAKVASVEGVKLEHWLVGLTRLINQL